MSQLRATGPDEIRLNIAAQSYAIGHVRQAYNYIMVVMVEIPAIPDDMDDVKKAMLEMEEIGVHHLNLIQFEVTKDNYRMLHFQRSNVCHRPVPFPVFESELCLLKLMAFQQGLGLHPTVR